MFQTLIVESFKHSCLKLDWVFILIITNAAQMLPMNLQMTSIGNNNFLLRIVREAASIKKSENKTKTRNTPTSKYSIIQTNARRFIAGYIYERLRVSIPCRLHIYTHMCWFIHFFPIKIPHKRHQIKEYHICTFGHCVQPSSYSVLFLSKPTFSLPLVIYSTTM